MSWAGVRLALRPTQTMAAKNRQAARQVAAGQIAPGI
jgi:hypothetical protein